MKQAANFLAPGDQCVIVFHRDPRFANKNFHAKAFKILENLRSRL